MSRKMQEAMAVAQDNGLQGRGPIWMSLETARALCAEQGRDDLVEYIDSAPRGMSCFIQVQDGAMAIVSNEVADDEEGEPCDE